MQVEITQTSAQPDVLKVLHPNVVLDCVVAAVDAAVNPCAVADSSNIDIRASHNAWKKLCNPVHLETASDQTDLERKLIPAEAHPSFQNYIKQLNLKAVCTFSIFDRSGT
eukprot:TRINITY_DN22200_c0_g3_i2.p3 TRINITY_DN22200_c0_g3~~TRINITY_DN22200_c0_g3_i2.p3  ORF type:complete len:110 (+),score=17.02 TRINITY_DN22200_c0_g3_i2:297-626(+)